MRGELVAAVFSGCASVTEGHAVWPTSFPGVQVTAECVPPYTGVATRACQENGVFGPILQPCTGTARECEALSCATHSPHQWALRRGDPARIILLCIARISAPHDGRTHDTAAAVVPGTNAFVRGVARHGGGAGGDSDMRPRLRRGRHRGHHPQMPGRRDVVHHHYRQLRWCVRCGLWQPGRAAHTLTMSSGDRCASPCVLDGNGSDVRGDRVGQQHFVPGDRTVSHRHGHMPAAVGADQRRLADANVHHRRHLGHRVWHLHR